jgi:uncharacterized repeat protein (TIGR01451 family)
MREATSAANSTCSAILLTKGYGMSKAVHRRAVTLAAVIALLLGAFVLINGAGGGGRANAVVPPSATSQHFPAHVHTDRGGFATLNLQVPVSPANVVIKVAAGGTHLAGEDPSFATVNFAGYVDSDTIRVRIIGWHAIVSTGRAEFRYYSNKDADLFVDVYERTAGPVPPTTAPPTTAPPTTAPPTTAPPTTAPTPTTVPPTTTPPTSADLAAGKSVTPTTAKVGETVIYTLSVKNNGPLAAVGTVIKDKLPAGLKVVDTATNPLPLNCSVTGDPATTGQTVLCTQGGVAVGATETDVVKATVVAPATPGNTLTNTVGVDASTDDAVSGNNSATASVIVLSTPPPAIG